MKRLIVAGTLVLLLAIIAGSVLRVDHTLLSLSTLTAEYDVIRLAMVALLAGLLFTSPPRSIHFRIVLGAMAGALFIGSAAMALTYAIGLVDAIIFLEVAIIFAMEAIEAPLLEKVPTQRAQQKRATKMAI